ncbi:MAG: PQQ-binding-like beta-propeller repeat protein [Phycisphaerales bacterium]|nr:PQQ-binding-like beta-propeller repeat protein [Phycisphaerales bacterium]
MAVFVCSVLLWVRPGLGAGDAEGVLAAAKTSGGLIVHLGCGEGGLTAGLGADGRSLVHGLDADEANVAKARALLKSKGLTGRVSVMHWTSKRLPYADNMVNLLVSDGSANVQPAEIMRVLCPLGAAYINSNGRWVKTVKPWPTDMDEWTHFLHSADGNAVSKDTLVGPPQRLRWVGSARYSRHHDEVLATSAMVSGAGRLLAIVDESPPSTFHPYIGGKFSLVARDAFNGLLLWKKPIKNWGWKSWGSRQNARFAQPIQLPKRIIVDGDRVYATMGFNAPVSVLDARTGRTIKVLEGTDYADELLLADGKLVLAVHEKPAPKPPKPSKPTRGRTPPPAGLRKKIMVLDPQSGKELWSSPWLDALAGRYDTSGARTHLELIVRAKRVFAMTKKQIVCYGLQDGKPLWSQPRGKHPTHRMMLAVNMSDNCTLVADDQRLYVAQPVGKLRNTFHTIPCDLYAYDAKTGKLLWSLPRRIGSFAWGIHADIFLTGGKLWSHEHIESAMKGADPVNSAGIPYALLAINPKTGAVEKRLNTSKIFNIEHHHRCYRNNATERFVLSGRRGTELTDLKSGEIFVSHWLRGECRFGMVPANGLLYAPPDPCACHIRIKVSGLLALAAGEATKASGAPKLVKGPAYRKACAPAAGANDWPMHRKNARRQGYSTQPVGELTQAWKIDLRDELSQAICVGKTAFVSCKNTHRVLALNAADGKEIWAFTAAGRIDSAPTFNKGRLLFGSADGHVYCLRAKDGKLAWRFNAAPAVNLILARGQLESSWPVHGSVMVCEDLAYFLAGRSSYLDGGIYAFALDAATGEIRKQRRINSTHNDKSAPYPKQTYDADGALNHILVSDGKTVYLQSKPLFGAGPAAAAPARPFLLATGGMLDGAMFNRFGWAFVGASKITGANIVHDDTRIYSAKAAKNMHRSSTFQVTSGYLLMEAQFPDKTEPFAQFEKTAFSYLGYRTSKPKFNWQVKIPVRGQAMLLTPNALLVAGLPDEISEKDPYVALEGRKGGKILTINRKTGEIRSTTLLDSPPVWDGLTMASNRIFVAQKNGKLICYTCK